MYFLYDPFMDHHRFNSGPLCLILVRSELISSYKITKDMAVRKKGRCYVRAWELVFDNEEDLKNIFSQLRDFKYGVLQGFARVHKQPSGKSHTHVGVILRQKKISDFLWANVGEYFTLKNGSTPRVREKLQCSEPNFHAKLLQYWLYASDKSKHPDEDISKFHLHKWDPEKSVETRTKSTSPRSIIEGEIMDGLTELELDQNIDDPLAKCTWSKQVRTYALRNYDQFARMIETLSDIRDRRLNAAAYKEAAADYRPFQKDLVKVQDEQGDRGIHCHYDPGDTGKNHFVTVEGMRRDTLILQNAETKRIAYLWNPKKHRRIIFDIPKHKMAFLNTTVIEKLKNGTLLSTMHKPKMKRSMFSPQIIILGNEKIDRTKWTGDRVTYSTTTKETLTLVMEENTQ